VPTETRQSDLPVFIFDSSMFSVECVFTSALTFFPLPREKKQLSFISGFTDERPAKPVV
jgi:hypothetical protein